MMRKFLMLFIALCLHSAARGQTWQYEYWFDNNRATVLSGTTTTSTIALQADVSGLSESLHAVHIQIARNGKLSAPLTRYFVKVPLANATVRCWIDDDATTQQTGVATGQTVALDINAVKEGFHLLHVQPEGQGGVPIGTPRTYPFLKVLATNQSDHPMQCYYALDGGSYSHQAGTLANGTYSFDINVAALTDGLHRISFLLCNDRGVATSAQTHFFIKIPVGGYGINEYWYWLNDDDTGENDVMKVPVSPKQNPFTLVTDLVLVQKDIRSTKFAFGFHDGNAAIFAKNDLHMRFFDVGGRFTDLVREYVDDRVYWEIEDLPLTQNSNGSTDLSAANSMQWYVLPLNQGNGLLLQLDHPATVQVFDSNGNEVYSAEGEESITWGDITADTSGNYYVVVHDPSTNSTNVTLNYTIVTKKGDANGDNDVTIDDAIAVVNHILGKPNAKFVESAADYNGDKRITIADVAGIVSEIVK